MSDEALKPCPFCGGEVYFSEKYSEVECTNTECFVTARTLHPLEWNRRAPSPAVRALVKACRNCWLDDEKQPERAIKEALEAVEREIGGAS